MIYINKNDVNLIDLTLSESTDIVNPNYLFQFIYEANIPDTDVYGNVIEPQIYFTTPDISFAPIRFNRFELTESNTGSETGGDDIPLKLLAGQYKYIVYATDITIDINSIDFNYFTEVEEGRMVVS